MLLIKNATASRREEFAFHSSKGFSRNNLSALVGQASRLPQDQGGLSGSPYYYE
jgi:hypothetical protein